MCGIAGFLGLPSDRLRDIAPIIDDMSSAIYHRGPDDCGRWIDASAQIALGHTRLSILDLSPEGHQPMASASDRYVLVFNGEIYNFAELRRDLESAGLAPQWRGHSDTEVMLAAFERWGVLAAVKRFNGMFAFAVWDRRDRTLTLARDRAGEKPLYYGWVNGAFLFGSELKALRLHPSWSGELDHTAVALYTRHGFIPGPYSIYRGIGKLPPGTLMTVHWSPDSAPRFDTSTYWSASDAVELGSATTVAGTDAELVASLDALLREAVGIRMVADVPVGAFLSGGIDSSTVVAMMQAQSRHTVRTFSIGFTEQAFDEAPHARAVARHLGTEHTELYVTPEEAMAVIPRLPHLYDEPFADSSQIPTYLVSQLARTHVTVALSGDAGDELFGGYNRYFRGDTLWRNTTRLPVALKRIGAATLLATSRSLRREWLRRAAPRLISRLTERTRKTAALLEARVPADVYGLLMTHWSREDGLTLGPAAEQSLFGFAGAHPRLDRTADAMMSLDFRWYLADDILVKVDRAAMAVSLETRVPFVDHRVVEFAWRLPLSVKLRHGQGKWILRQVLSRYVPPALVERPKQGFAVPVGRWIAGPLRDWAESLLSPGDLAASGLFDVKTVRMRWDEHRTGSVDWQDHLWSILMFQAWYRSLERTS